ncbi:rhodanese-like domain-containing protein [Cereibacter azotoformans]|uniref:Rhodanese-like domain-containing protein n=1 Tax=Cereibacter azotoformans TaxID=43057 RepID=A0A2T5JT47_9RHOB|nr:rhodanese-like domain-containing protein [Cereibacter azotoformans]PTR12988.1 rhodanese-like domain-containing protein [Cereibacter azotoformans]UIJ32784.1 rhodanese-like domain-containing protein [Cereibacter azotoformans]
MTDAQLPAAPDQSPVLVTAEGYTGDLSPQSAWDLVTSGNAMLIDVRTAEERSFVSRVPGSKHVAWATGTAITRNPHFVRQVGAIAAKDTTLVVLCRSGKRSASAAEATTTDSVAASTAGAFAACPASRTDA